MGLSSYKNPFRKLSESLTRHLAAASPSRATAGLPIAVDFGVGSLKILQVAAGNPPALVAAAGLDTPIELWADHKRRLDFQLEALPKLIRHGGFKGKRAVCAIPSWQVFCKHLQFPRADRVDVGELVAAAVPMQLQCDPSAVVFRHLEIESAKANGRVEAVVIATPRNLVDRLMKGLMASRLEPVGIHTEFSAALRAFDAIHRRDGDLDINTLYLDLGASTTNVMISHGVSIAFARVVDVGGRNFDETIVKQLKCTPEEARTMRLAMGQTPGPSAKEPVAVAAGVPLGGHPGEERRATELMPGFAKEFLSQPEAGIGPEGSDLSEPLEILTDEVSMCLRYHASQFPDRKVDRAVFIGGEARSLGLCQQIARALKVSAQMADPLARVARTGAEPALGVDLKRAQPGWTVPLGLCLSPTDL
ncbi:hypothetical protein PHYC_02656 [Phycisphaerales bacterium]|nr:hypothetical protein PHYC_02656 [Phycisphaerales bacterium]